MTFKVFSSVEYKREVKAVAFGTKMRNSNWIQVKLQKQGIYRVISEDLASPTNWRKKIIQINKFSAISLAYLYVIDILREGN